MPTDTPKHAKNLLEAASECMSKDMPFTATAITHLTLLTETVNAMNAKHTDLFAKHTDLFATVTATNKTLTATKETLTATNKTLTATKETLTATNKTLDRTSRLSRMAMLKAVEAELKSERLAYLDILLRAKRKVTGSGTAGFVMDMAHASLLIASVIASGGAGLGLAVGASVVKSARNNANGMDAAINASKVAESKISNISMTNARDLADIKGAATTSEHDKVNTGIRAGADASWLALNRINGFKEEVKGWKHGYDFLKLSPPIGGAPYQLTELKRKNTAYKHHGEGGTFAIEHDFCIAIGMAYVDFLSKLATGGDKMDLLLTDAEQQQNLAGPHLITKHILSDACNIYSVALKSNAAYKVLMTNRGDPRIYGYSGSDALAAVTTAASVLRTHTKDGLDFKDVQVRVERELNL